ncbi:MAG: hypothetical protein VKN17_02540 [Cyanobacteriota bacterium]|nr:hypothetical protein [Cyanobacteriota bacterium]
MACGAVISLLDSRRSRQVHWWLADAGFPQHLARLLGAPLRASGRPPHTWRELTAVFAPLQPLPSMEPATTAAATYRYLICLDRCGNRLSCWRRYPEGVGWQRRCGPMPLGRFIRRFSERLTSPA